jgi:hypothetical protein
LPVPPTTAIFIVLTLHSKRFGDYNRIGEAEVLAN